MFKTGLRHSIAICCAALLPVGLAQALPVYVGNTIATNGYLPPVQALGTTNTPTTYNVVGAGGSASSVSHDANGGSVESTAQSIAFDPLVPTNNQAGALTTLTYRIDIVSLDPLAPPFVTIPIRIVASGSVQGADLAPSASNYAYIDASAQFIVERNNGQVVVNQSLETMSYVTDTFNFDQVLDFLGSDYLTVTLRAYAGAGGGGAFDPGYAHAFVDPTFTIDPAFASRYQLVGIPGAVVTPPVTPPNGVPEPSTAWLLLFGVGMLATVGRVRMAARRPMVSCETLPRLRAMDAVLPRNRFAPGLA